MRFKQGYRNGSIYMSTRNNGKGATGLYPSAGTNPFASWFSSSTASASLSPIQKGPFLSFLTKGPLPPFPTSLLSFPTKEPPFVIPDKRPLPSFPTPLLSFPTKVPSCHFRQKSPFAIPNKRPLPSFPIPLLSFPTLVIGNPESSLPAVSFINRPTPWISRLGGHARLAEGI